MTLALCLVAWCTGLSLVWVMGRHYLRVSLMRAMILALRQQELVEAASARAHNNPLSN